MLCHSICYMLLLWCAAGPKRIVDKMLRNLWLVGYIQMLLPRACIVHVARHPLDVALSCYAQPFGYRWVRRGIQCVLHIIKIICHPAALTAGSELHLDKQEAGRAG